MKILIAGATGFIGSHVANSLAAQGHHVKALVRSKTKASQKLSNKIAFISWRDYRETFELDDIEFDVVINFMGENIAGKRWTEARKKSLYDSRILGTKNLFESLGTIRFKRYFQASAVGIYGDRKDEKLHEQSKLADDFLAKICKDWEAVASEYGQSFEKACFFRFGIVLGDEGALEKMLPPFKMGLGGRLGSGKQYMSWIHIDDVVAGIEACLSNREWSGVFNMTSPNPVRNSDFTQTLGDVLGKPTILPAPKFGLKLLLGEMSTLLLAGQKVQPKALVDKGFKFKYPRLSAALKDIVSK